MEYILKLALSNSENFNSKELIIAIIRDSNEDNKLNLHLLLKLLNVEGDKLIKMEIIKSIVCNDKTLLTEDVFNQIYKFDKTCVTTYDILKLYVSKKIKCNIKVYIKLYLIAKEKNDIDIQQILYKILYKDIIKTISIIRDIGEGSELLEKLLREIHNNYTDVKIMLGHYKNNQSHVIPIELDHQNKFNEHPIVPVTTYNKQFDSPFSTVPTTTYNQQSDVANRIDSPFSTVPATTYNQQSDVVAHRIDSPFSTVPTTTYDQQSDVVAHRIDSPLGTVPATTVPFSPLGTFTKSVYDEQPPVPATTYKQQSGVVANPINSPFGTFPPTTHNKQSAVVANPSPFGTVTLSAYDEQPPVPFNPFGTVTLSAYDEQPPVPATTYNQQSDVVNRIDSPFGTVPPTTHNKQSAVVANPSPFGTVTLSAYDEQPTVPATTYDKQSDVVANPINSPFGTFTQSAYDEQPTVPFSPFNAAPSNKHDEQPKVPQSAYNQQFETTHPINSPFSPFNVAQLSAYAAQPIIKPDNVSSSCDPCDYFANFKPREKVNISNDMSICFTYRGIEYKTSIVSSNSNDEYANIKKQLIEQLCLPKNKTIRILIDNNTEINESLWFLLLDNVGNTNPPALEIIENDSSSNFNGELDYESVDTQVICVDETNGKLAEKLADTQVICVDETNSELDYESVDTQVICVDETNDELVEKLSDTQAICVDDSYYFDNLKPRELVNAKYQGEVSLEYNGKTYNTVVDYNFTCTDPYEDIKSQLREQLNLPKNKTVRLLTRDGEEFDDDTHILIYIEFNWNHFKIEIVDDNGSVKNELPIVEYKSSTYSSTQTKSLATIFPKLVKTDVKTEVTYNKVMKINYMINGDTGFIRSIDHSSYDTDINNIFNTCQKMFSEITINDIRVMKGDIVLDRSNYVDVIMNSYEVNILNIVLIKKCIITSCKKTEIIEFSNYKEFLDKYNNFLSLKSLSEEDCSLYDGDNLVTEQLFNELFSRRLTNNLEFFVKYNYIITINKKKIRIFKKQTFNSIIDLISDHGFTKFSIDKKDVNDEETFSQIINSMENKKTITVKINCH